MLGFSSCILFSNSKSEYEEIFIFSVESDKILINCFFSVVVKLDVVLLVNKSLIQLYNLISPGKYYMK